MVDTSPRSQTEPSTDVVDVGRRAAIKLGVGAGLAGIADGEGPDCGGSGEAGGSGAAAVVSGCGSTKTTQTVRSAMVPWTRESRMIVDYATNFSEASHVGRRYRRRPSYALLDSMAALVAGFEAEPVRIGARLAQTIRGDAPSTVLGYGIGTTPKWRHL